jgi:hypothetical protein
MTWRNEDRMLPKQLGRLEPVELRGYWTDEARDFTPWLAQVDNLALLSEAIGMELELEGIEVPVGPYRADIVARDVPLLQHRHVEADDHAQGEVDMSTVVDIGVRCEPA